MKYCLQCGKELSLDYEHKKLICEYCHKEYDYIDETNEKEYVCLSCDVDFISDKPKLDCCPYCASKNITVIKLKKNMNINGIVTFEKTKKHFIKTYKKILRKKFFVPNKFYKNGVIKTCNNIYLPYYLCDMYAKAKVYIDTKKTSNWMLDNYRYNKIDDYVLLRHCEADLNNVMIVISNKINHINLNNIMPYDLDKISKYEDNVLNDYIYEDCNNSFEKEKLRNEIETIVIKNLFEKINDYDSIELESIQTTISKFKYKKVLLPLYILNIEYKNKLYYFIMNGQTGKIHYKLPTSKIKMLFSYIILLIIIFMLLVLLRSVL